MASYTIEIPERLHHEIQERRHQIDVASIVTQALTAAVSNGRPIANPGPDATEAINQMFSG